MLSSVSVTVGRTANLHVLGGKKVARDLCELVERLYSQGRKVAVWVADPGRAKVLDGYLWTFSQSSFVPHVLWSGGEAPEEPVVIVTGTLTNPNSADVLVVAEPLDDGADLEPFSEIHELCSGLTQEERMGFWQEAGYQVKVVAARAVEDR